MKQWLSTNRGALKDCSLVVVPNGTVLGLINLVDLKTMAELTLVLITIGYTLWRWNRDAKRKL